MQFPTLPLLLTFIPLIHATAIPNLPSSDNIPSTEEATVLKPRGLCLPSDSNAICKNRFDWNRWQLNFFDLGGGAWDWHGRASNPGIYIKSDGWVQRGKEWAMPQYVTIEWKNGDVKTFWVPDMGYSCDLGVPVGGIHDAWACA